MLRPDQQDQETSNNNRSLALIFIALASFLAALAFWYDQTSTVAGTSAESPILKGKKREELERAVNNHIQLTNRKIETDKEKIKQEASFTIPRVGQLLLTAEGQPVDPIDMRGDRNEFNSTRDMRRDRLETPSAGDIIQQDLADNQARERQNAEYMKEYARQFVENARRNGYEVELDSEYKVKNVRQVKPAAGTDTGIGQGPAFR